MPPKHKAVPVEVVAEPDPIVETLVVAPVVADASAALYRDRSGPAREPNATEGASYRDTTARLAREAAGVVTPEES